MRALNAGVVLVETAPQRVTSAASNIVPAEASYLEDSIGHLNACANCEALAGKDEIVVLCRQCPRIFCVYCARSCAIQIVRPLATVRARSSSCGRDLETNKCPSCLRRTDDEFPAPVAGVVPTAHLLQEIFKHDLSRLFREPVDIEEYPDYLRKVGREHMMDLQTMMQNLTGGKYATRRGRGKYKEHLNRIWHNCRYYADCDELGSPLYDTVVPGIVRCALILEGMVGRFYAQYMPNEQGILLPYSTWDGWRQVKQLENEQARRRLLERSQDLEVAAVEAQQHELVTAFRGQNYDIPPGADVTHHAVHSSLVNELSHSEKVAGSVEEVESASQGRGLKRPRVAGVPEGNGSDSVVIRNVGGNAVHVENTEQTSTHPDYGDGKRSTRSVAIAVCAGQDGPSEMEKSRERVSRKTANIEYHVAQRAGRQHDSAAAKNNGRGGAVVAKVEEVEVRSTNKTNRVALAGTVLSIPAAASGSGSESSQMRVELHGRCSSIPEYFLFDQLCDVAVKFSSIGVLERASTRFRLRGQAVVASSP